MAHSRPLLLSLLILATVLAGCDQIAVLDGSKAREADGVAIGSACRQAGRAIEDCFTMNPDSPKASIFAGWKEMNDYMVQNKLETVAPQLAKAEVKPKADAEAKAEAKAETKADAKADAAHGAKDEAKPGAKDESREGATDGAKDKARDVTRENAFKEPAKTAAAPLAEPAAPGQGATLVFPSPPAAGAAPTPATGPKVVPPLPTVVKPIPQPH